MILSITSKPFHQNNNTITTTFPDHPGIPTSPIILSAVSYWLKPTTSQTDYCRIAWQHRTNVSLFWTLGMAFRINLEGCSKHMAITHMKPEQNGWHLTDDTFKHILLNKNYCILIEISLKFVPKGPIDNNSALVEVMAWCRTGTKSLPQPMMTKFTNTNIHHQTSMG